MILVVAFESMTMAAIWEVIFLADKFIFEVAESELPTLSETVIAWALLVLTISIWLKSAVRVSVPPFNVVPS